MLAMRTPHLLRPEQEKMMNTFRYMQYPVDYKSASQRLYFALISQGIIPPPAEKLYDAVLDTFENKDFEYVNALLQGSDDRVWHLVTFGEQSGDITRGHDHYNVAETTAEALGFVLEELDHARIFPTVVTTADGRVELATNNGLVARIERVVFDSVNAQQRHRAEQALSGIRVYGEVGRLNARLMELPGLENLSDYLDTDRNKKPKGSMAHKTPGNFSRAMRIMLQERFGLETKSSQAQELTASLFGVKSWQHLIANADQERVWLRPVCVGTLCGSSTWEYDFKHYRTAEDALWSFSQTVRKWSKNPVVPACGGTQSTGALYLFTHGPEGYDPMTHVEPHAIISCAMPLVFCSEEYFNLAGKMLVKPEQLNIRLYEHFRVTDGFDQKVRASNRRIGVQTENELRAGGWLFTLRTDRWNTTYLHAEKFDTSGRRTNAFSVKTVDAEISYGDDSNDLWVFRGWGREPTIPLAGFSEQEIDALIKFSGIYLSPVVEVRHETNAR